MAVTNEQLTRVGNNLGAAIEAALEHQEIKGSTPPILVKIEVAQLLFAITQELIAFRSDYPDVQYSKVIEDQFGTRGEQ